MASMTPAYSVVIATLHRPARLDRTLRDLLAQSCPPELIVVVDASDDSQSRDICTRLADAKQPVLHLRAEATSSARQRNQGATLVRSPLIAFVDDDVELPSELFERLLNSFATDQADTIGGVSARIEGMAHFPPGPLLRLYYRLQAGFDHPHYGACLFGLGINCLPCYLPDDPALIPSDWLNSTCTLYRRDLFDRERFPAFDGYSFMEDVHLSFRIGRTHRLYFHRDATYRHLDEPTRFKRDLPRRIRMQMVNRMRVARELLDLRGWRLLWCLTLLRCFETALLLRNRPPFWFKTLIAVWNPLPASPKE
jgi:glycosyltransferase involved in cell wall biosynthesis